MVFGCAHHIPRVHAHSLLLSQRLQLLEIASSYGIRKLPPSNTTMRTTMPTTFTTLVHMYACSHATTAPHIPVLPRRLATLRHTQRAFLQTNHTLRTTCSCEVNHSPNAFCIALLT